MGKSQAPDRTRQKVQLTPRSCSEYPDLNVEEAVNVYCPPDLRSPSMGLLCPTLHTITQPISVVKPIPAALLAMPHFLHLLLFSSSLLALSFLLVPFRLLGEDIHEVIHQLRMLIIYTSGNRKVCPLHRATHRKQANRSAGSTLDLFALHKQINLFYEFFWCASRRSASASLSSRLLISSRIASAVMSAIIQLFAF